LRAVALLRVGSVYSTMALPAVACAPSGDCLVAYVWGSDSYIGGIREPSPHLPAAGVAQLLEPRIAGQ